jgi:competence protein ComEA
VTHGRTAALAIGLLGALAAGAWGQARWPATGPVLDCPAERVRWEGEGALGAARCDVGGEPPASVRVALGIRLPLNRVSEAELARLPGVGSAAAHALVQARPFRSWAEVDSVRGVGPVRLQVLQRGTELDP